MAVTVVVYVASVASAGMATAMTAAVAGALVCAAAAKPEERVR